MPGWNPSLLPPPGHVQKGRNGAGVPSPGRVCSASYWPEALGQFLNVSGLSSLGLYIRATSGTCCPWVVVRIKVKSSWSSLCGQRKRIRLASIRIREREGDCNGKNETAQPGTQIQLPRSSSSFQCGWYLMPLTLVPEADLSLMRL